MHLRVFWRKLLTADLMKWVQMFSTDIQNLKYMPRTFRSPLDLSQIRQVLGLLFVSSEPQDFSSNCPLAALIIWKCTVESNKCLLPQSLKTSWEIARWQNLPQTSSFDFPNIGRLDSINFQFMFLCFATWFELWLCAIPRPTLPKVKHLRYWLYRGVLNSCSFLTWDPWVLLEHSPSSVSHINLDPQFHFAEEEDKRVH